MHCWGKDAISGCVCEECYYIISSLYVLHDDPVKLKCSIRIKINSEMGTENNQERGRGGKKHGISGGVLQ